MSRLISKQKRNVNTTDALSGKKHRFKVYDTVLYSLDIRRRCGSLRSRPTERSSRVSGRLRRQIRHADWQAVRGAVLGLGVRLAVLAIPGVQGRQPFSLSCGTFYD